MPTCAVQIGKIVKDRDVSFVRPITSNLVIPIVDHAPPRDGSVRYTLQQRRDRKNRNYYAGHALQFCSTCFVNIDSQVTTAIRDVVSTSYKYITL